MTTPSRFDLEANAELDRAEAERVDVARARAEKWLPWATALTALIATVSFIKGPESIDKLESWAPGWIGGLIVLGLVLLGAALYVFYAAAFGDPFNRELLDRQPIVGLHARLVEYRRDADKKAHVNMRNGISLTVVGVLCVVIATGLTWIARPGDSASTKATCVFDGDTVVVGVSGASLSVTDLGEGFTIAPCP